MKHRHLGFLLSSLILTAFFADMARAVNSVTVESRCASGAVYTEGGTGWGNSNAKSNKTPCTTGSRSSKDAGAYADFIPPVTIEGYYDAYLTWGTTTASNNGPNAEHVQVSIMDRNGTQSTFVDMRGSSSCTSNANQLIYIGRGVFVPGQGHKVRVSNNATGQCYNGASKRYVTADALILNFVAPVVPVTPSSWSLIKTIYRD